MLKILVPVYLILGWTEIVKNDKNIMDVWVLTKYSVFLS